MTTSISRFYEFVDSMKETIVKVDEDIKFNTMVIDILSKANEELKNDRLKEFVETINETTTKYKEQKEVLNSKIELGNSLISVYQNDNDKFEKFLDDILNCFGFDKE